MIPIAIVKQLDLHRNANGVLCQVINGELVPYEISNDSHSVPDLPIPDPVQGIVATIEPAEPVPGSPAEAESGYTKEQILEMNWREQKALCQDLDLPEKPLELTWEQHLLEQLEL